VPVRAAAVWITWRRLTREIATTECPTRPPFEVARRAASILAHAAGILPRLGEAPPGSGSLSSFCHKKGPVGVYNVRPEREAIREPTAMPEIQSLDAFEELFIRHYPRVCGVLRRLVGQPDEAEDLALEAFFRLWKHRASVEGHAEAWLYRVAANLGYNALRAGKRREAYESRAGSRAVELSEDGDPPAAYERSERIERVRQTLRRMTPRQAQILALRHAGLSYKEVAEALGLAPGSVGTLLARAETEFETLFPAEEQP
jgi:RNA polymerase sigma-70 factor (ECF subfamily)